MRKIFIKGNVANEVAAPKQQPGQDIAIHGSAELVRSLTRHGPVDEYRRTVIPVTVGKGKRLLDLGLPGDRRLRCPRPR